MSIIRRAGASAITFTLGAALALVPQAVFGNPQAPTSTEGRASAIAAQGAPLESRWSPWVGCWQLTEETVDEGDASMARLFGLAAPTTEANAGARVCVRPAGASATLTTQVKDRPLLTETIVADGTRQPLQQTDCRGWQRAEWSTLGARLFAEAEITCGDLPTRKVSGLSMIIAGPRWIEIQMIESQGQRHLRLRRYHTARAKTDGTASDDPVRPMSSLPLASRLSLADVKEANGKVSPEVLQAALLELRGGFDLNGKRLIELEDAGVSRGVLDLMIALSFPKQFVVEQPIRGGGFSSGGSWGFGGFGLDDDLWSYYGQHDFYSSFYAPFGYRYWGGYDPFYFTGPGFVVLNPPTSGGSPTPEASGDGRVVDGRGYTRVRRTDPTPVNTANGGNWGTSSSGSGNSGSSNSGSSSGVSSGGYSSGGSSGSGERTAQPRPPGGR